DEHMTKESAHFILSGPQLIRVVAYTYEVPESQVEIVIEDETCCSKFCHDGIETITDIAISNVNILTLDVDKVNLLQQVSSSITISTQLSGTSNIDDRRRTQIYYTGYDSFSNGESTSTIERIAAVSLGEQISFVDVGYRSRQVIDGEMLLKIKLQFNYFVLVHEDQAKN
ncbi:MAG: hypothetical protein EZS28_049089, partial [Streblomastix strix]